MIGLNTRYLIFSMNSFAATLLALYIGFSLDLPRPYWAMLTVYITVQPLSGALRSKAVYRVLGTILGGAAAVLLVPNLVNSPAILALALAGWVGICLYFSLLDRTPRAYVSMLAGYTAGIIGFAAVEAPDQIFLTAVARVEEITLGIVCAAMVHSVFWPRSVTGALAARLGQIMAEVRSWAAEAVSGTAHPESEQIRRRLAADIAEVHILATHLPFDTARVRPRNDAVKYFQDRLAFTLPLATGVEDRLTALQADGQPLPDELTALLAQIRAWIERGDVAESAEAATLIEGCAAMEPAITPQSDWHAMLMASAAVRMRELVEAIEDCRELYAYIRDPETGLAPRLIAPARHVGRRPLYRDKGLAVLSAVAAMIAILCCSVAWIGLSWPEGGTAATMAAVFSSFFATQDDPAPALFRFLVLVVVSLPLAALYLFAVLPAADGFPMLALVLAPVFLVLGYIQANPATAPAAMPLLIGIAGSLALQAVFTSDFPAFVNGNIALVLGVAAAFVITRLFRSVGADWSARRLFSAGWRELARIARPGAIPDRPVWISLMIDRLGLLTPRLAIAPRPEFAKADALNDVRIGLNIIDLQEARRDAAMAADTAIKRLLNNLAAYFQTLTAWKARPSSSAMLGQLDRALAGLAACRPTAERYYGIVALAGLRRNLFPSAPAYDPIASATALDEPA